MSGRRGFRCALSKRAYPGSFVVVGAVSKEPQPVGVGLDARFQSAPTKEPQPVGAVSNRATLARDRPSRYDKGEGYRSAGAVTPIPTRCRKTCIAYLAPASVQLSESGFSGFTGFSE